MVSSLSVLYIVHDLEVAAQRRRGRDDSEDSSSSSPSPYCVSGTISRRLFDLESAFHVGYDQSRFQVLI